MQEEITEKVCNARKFYDVKKIKVMLHETHYLPGVTYETEM
jgi:hypothetical protein